MKFESKLNNMHSAHRDLESKYKRTLTELANANKQVVMLTTKLTERNDQVTSLEVIKAEHESKIALDTEEIASTKRELAIKLKQLRETENRMQKAVDDTDLFRTKLQESQKDNTEMKLRIDVL